VWVAALTELNEAASCDANIIYNDWQMGIELEG